jgi:chemotaxis protein histidine kinase CheA
MAVEAEDAFQKELIELFVQEAHEWLQQIHVALDELQQGPAPDRHLKLAQTIKAGITNLGGSAATIGLNDVERASFASLPFVQAVHDPAASISANDFLVLCKQLGHIHTALTRATGVTFEADQAAVPDSLPLTVPADELLTALENLGRSSATSRNLIHTVISQIQGLRNNGVAQCDVNSMREFLGRLAEADETFLSTVQQQVPRVADGIAQLRAETDLPVRAPERVQALQEQAASLWTSAQQVNAAHAMTFFMGLHSFLTVVSQQRVAITAQRYEAVESRLKTVMLAVQSWVDAGRAERAAVDGVLPAQA